jgi:hypothetical protein
VAFAAVRDQLLIEGREPVAGDGAGDLPNLLDLCPVSGPYPRRFAPDAGADALPNFFGPNFIGSPSETDGNPHQFAPGANAGGRRLPR